MYPGARPRIPPEQESSREIGAFVPTMAIWTVGLGGANYPQMSDERLAAFFEIRAMQVAIGFREVESKPL